MSAKGISRLVQGSGIPKGLFTISVVADHWRKISDGPEELCLMTGNATCIPA
jgi:hypothetical protein